MKSTARPAPAGLLTRVVGGLRSAWFGPSVPLAPEAPPDTAGRQFDYPVGFNLRLQPRQDEGTSFAELRGLADAYDLVRLVIERTRRPTGAWPSSRTVSMPSMKRSTRSSGTCPAANDGDGERHPAARYQAA